MSERLTVGEVCTRSVTIAFRTTLLNGAARLMRENHVGSLVVVDEIGGKRIVVGILTDRDIVTSVLALDLDCSTLMVEDVMSTDVVTARENDSLIDVMQIMRRKGVRRVPVVGPEGELIGLVTLDDLLEILAQELGLLVSAIETEGQRERRLRPGGHLGL
jgi:CBS domain-containing protein